jgi:hypothetical protein
MLPGKSYRGFTRMSADQEEIAGIAVIARNRRDRKGNLTRNGKFARSANQEHLAISH